MKRLNKKEKDKTGLISISMIDGIRMYTVMFGDGVVKNLTKSEYDKVCINGSLIDY